MSVEPTGVDIEGPPLLATGTVGGVIGERVARAVLVGIRGAIGIAAQDLNGPAAVRRRHARIEEVERARTERRPQTEAHPGALGDDVHHGAEAALVRYVEGSFAYLDVIHFGEIDVLGRWIHM